MSKEQLERLGALLPGWTGEAFDETVTVSENGAGFGSPAKNAVVEAIAMAEVIRFYGNDWTYDDVSADKVGWDITFTHKKTGQVVRAEVKGVSGAQPIVLLTANELKAAENQEGWSLAVVTSALNRPQVTEYSAGQALDAARPYVFKAHFPDA